MRSHSPPCKGGGRGDSRCADESPSNSPFARGRIELPLQRLHDGAALPLLFQRRGQGYVPTSLQSRRDDRVQAGATPPVSWHPHTKVPKGRQSPGRGNAPVSWHPHTKVPKGRRNTGRGIAPVSWHPHHPKSRRDDRPCASVPSSLQDFFFVLSISRGVAPAWTIGALRYQLTELAP